MKEILLNNKFNLTNKVMKMSFKKSFLIPTIFAIGMNSFGGVLNPVYMEDIIDMATHIEGNFEVDKTISKNSDINNVCEYIKKCGEKTYLNSYFYSHTYDADVYSIDVCTEDIYSIYYFDMNYSNLTYENTDLTVCPNEVSTHDYIVIIPQRGNTTGFPIGAPNQVYFDDVKESIKEHFFQNKREGKIKDKSIEKLINF